VVADSHAHTGPFILVGKVMGLMEGDPNRRGAEVLTGLHLNGVAYLVGPRLVGRNPWRELLNLYE